MTFPRDLPHGGLREAAGNHRAAALLDPGRIQVLQAPRRDPGPGEVEVRVEGCGVSGAQLPVWEGRPWFDYPLPPGHPGREGWGVVERVGPGVAPRVGPGERVTFLSRSAFAEYDVARADRVVPLAAALVGPFPGEALASAVNVLRRSGIRAGHLVAVVGIGFLGALVTQLAVRRGARVLAFSRRPFALEVAWAMGAEETLLIEEGEDPVVQVRDRTGGRLCDVVVEAAGLQATLDLAAELVRVRGRLVVAGYHEDGLRQVTLQLWNWRGIDVVNAHERDPRAWVRGLRESVAAVAEGRLEIRPLITHRLPLDRLDLALDLLRLRPTGFLKGVVTL